MAPSKSRAQDDSKSETPTGKDKNGGHGHSTSSSTKIRRVGSSTGSQLKETTNASSLPTAPAAPAVSQTTAPTGLQWSSFDRNVLHSYRRVYRLNTPTAFVHDYNRRILTQPGSIGLRSPSMARKLDLRRQSKEQLATTARKHFNSIGIQENDVIVDFLHKVRNKDAADLMPRRADHFGLEMES
ncbi:uncharacterized protein E0L32_010633 [Thyridium curvatum]|uniref:Histone deacetylase complex subunit SAP30 Sin3 binding domain-containing protein n=1 Tax=Thyridium curvatum TaxID=1093900 RepID=A0A507AEE4_9PEZI|nr:uncharacterized protein E0L32_010633 [Thyridium curvatum]TPX07635.1 hypothetical protein E0L32_010633 [Thyridium curvatum]